MHMLHWTDSLNTKLQAYTSVHFTPTPIPALLLTQVRTLHTASMAAEVYRESLRSEQAEASLLGTLSECKSVQQRLTEAALVNAQLEHEVHALTLQAVAAKRKLSDKRMTDLQELRWARCPGGGGIEGDGRHMCMQCSCVATAQQQPECKVRVRMVEAMAAGDGSNDQAPNRPQLQTSAGQAYRESGV